VAHGKFHYSQFPNIFRQLVNSPDEAARR